MTRITAEQARELAGPTIEERVEAVYPLIRAAAEKRLRSITLNSGGFWCDEGYDQTAAYKQACDLLRKDGFNVEFFYQELQFVDMGTKISW
jgi:hypothetical protein